MPNKNKGLKSQQPDPTVKTKPIPQIDTKRGRPTANPDTVTKTLTPKR